MKKFLLSLTLIAAALTVQAEDGKLRVKMNCKPVGDSIVALLNVTEDHEVRKSFTGKQGVFDFEIDVPNPASMYLVEPAALRGEPASVFVIPAIPGEEVQLTPTEYGILKFLTENAGRVFSIEQIYEKVWDEPAYNPENTVAVHIRRIREKIEIDPKNPRYLKVVWGVGYKVEKH